MGHIGKDSCNRRTRNRRGGDKFRPATSIPLCSVILPVYQDAFSGLLSHDDVQDEPSYFQMGTVSEAVEYVTTSQRDWSIEARGTLFPDCVEGED